MRRRLGPVGDEHAGQAVCGASCLRSLGHRAKFAPLSRGGSPVSRSVRTEPVRPGSDFRTHAAPRIRGPHILCFPSRCCARDSSAAARAPCVAKKTHGGDRASTRLCLGSPARLRTAALPRCSCVSIWVTSWAMRSRPRRLSADGKAGPDESPRGFVITSILGHHPETPPVLPIRPRCYDPFPPGPVWPACGPPALRLSPTSLDCGRDRLFPLLGIETHGPHGALVGDTPVEADEIEPLRHPGIISGDAVVHVID